MRATVYTMITTVTLGVGHWLIWLCCIPLFFIGQPADSHSLANFLWKLQTGLTPPFGLGLFAFTSQDFSPEFGGSEMIELIGFSILGLFVWGIAAVVFWTAFLAPRFRAFTGREEVRYPENYHDPHEKDNAPRPPGSRREPPPLPTDSEA
jgi:hypothetical protein